MLMYSSGMPLLYPIGMFQMIATYWVDKYLCKQRITNPAYLVLRFYKTPPRYGIEMSNVVRNVMQQAVWVHMLFGFYMFSNSQIFTYSTKVAYVEELKKQIAKNGGGLVTSLLDKTVGQYLSTARIFQPHAITYLIGIILYIVL